MERFGFVRRHQRRFGVRAQRLHVISVLLVSDGSCDDFARHATARLGFRALRRGLLSLQRRFEVHEPAITALPLVSSAQKVREQGPVRRAVLGN